MKTVEESKTFLKLGEKTCDLLRVAYPSYDISVEYDDSTECLIFYIGTNTYKVNVVGDSVLAGVIDIANQLLNKILKDNL